MFDLSGLFLFLALIHLVSDFIKKLVPLNLHNPGSRVGRARARLGETGEVRAGGDSRTGQW